MNKYRFFKISLFIIAAVFILLLYFFVEPKNGNLPKCLFHQLTGLYCPGCGVQRSFHALLNGKILKAIDYNLLFIVLLPLIIYFIAIFVLDKKYSPNSFIYRKNFSLFIVIFVISFWIMRNIPLFPFNWLAP